MLNEKSAKIWKTKFKEPKQSLGESNSAVWQICYPYEELWTICASICIILTLAQKLQRMFFFANFPNLAHEWSLFSTRSFRNEGVLDALKRLEFSFTIMEGKSFCLWAGPIWEKGWRKGAGHFSYTHTIWSLKICCKT